MEHAVAEDLDRETSHTHGGQYGFPDNPPMPLQGKRLAFIGGGTMAEAMVRGLFDKHLVPPSPVPVTGPGREGRAALSKRFGGKTPPSHAERAPAAAVDILLPSPHGATRG